MRLLLFSDSHGKLSALRNLKKRIIAEGLPDAVLFLGDGANDWQELDLTCPIYPVRGNCDPPGLAREEWVLPFMGQQIYLSHGHLHRVKRGIDLLAASAKAAQAGIAVYGHTHRQGLDLMNNVYCINPGALNQGEYAWLRLEEGGIHPQFKTF